MNRYKYGNNYKGKASEEVAKANGWTELEESEDAYVASDNQVIVSEKQPEKSLLLSEKPSEEHYNEGGKWALKPEAKPSPSTDERIDTLESQVAELIKASKKK